MTTGAIIMMVFGLVITWGGAIVCFRIALKNK
ncbi:methionine/alanine import family NSS transporter small subunit [Maridesulfovibrio frigidus]|nr:methionine/alanine import family NSS transporter small subunit [Maridesulfovibrio frigidus]